MLSGGHKARPYISKGKIGYGHIAMCPYKIKIRGFRSDTDYGKIMQDDLKLHEKIRKYEAVLNSLMDGVIIISRDMQTLWANKAITDLYGNTEEMYREKCYKFFYRLNEPCPGCPSKEVFTDGKPHRRMQYVIDQNNKPRWRNVRANPYYDEDNNLLGSIEVISDHTKIKKTEKELKRSEEKYRTIIENIKEGVFEVDLSGSFTFVNESQAKIFGCSRDELLGTN